MSHKEMLTPVLIDGNTISIANKSKTIDFRLAIRKVCDDGFTTTSMPIRNGFNDKVFVVLFDDTDTDFGIDLYNRSDTKNMRLDITYGKTYRYIVDKNQTSFLKTLESYGKYLRFLTPNRPSGQSLADLYPSGEIDPKSEVQIICSQMKFSLQAEKYKDTRVEPKSEPIVEKSLSERQVFIKEEEKVFKVSSIVREVGKRGVIGFGHKSDTVFPHKYYGFIADEDYYVEPFFIEFRLKNWQIVPKNNFCSFCHFVKECNH